MVVQLTAEQASFVMAPEGASQSLQSWAGTGKTHTLTERVVRLLTEHGVAPEAVVVTTFTVEGARECSNRINARMGRESGVRVGTMDSLASQWMRRFFQPDDYYIGVQEYGTLLLGFLRSEEGALIKDRVKYFIVDEFQDLSRVQLDTVMEFHRAGAAILAIGDVAQNIYEWRGCHGRFLTTLPQRIPAMLNFQLTENRRCTPDIIALGNACLRVLRLRPPGEGAADEGLMRPVRPSARVRPVLVTLPPRTSLGTHVMRVMRRYGRFGDTAVLARYKHALFDVEEKLVRSNASATATSQLARVIPFVTSATVGEGDRGPPRRKDGHATLMTLHQSKGLEWPVVVLVLWDPEKEPEASDEQWRLLYVAVTRARDHLYIVSPSASTTRAVMGRLNPKLFAAPDGSDLVQQPVAESAGDGPALQEPKDRSIRGVVDAVRSLTCEQISAMRAASLIPLSLGVVRASPGCKVRVARYRKDAQRFVESSPTEEEERAKAQAQACDDDDDVDANGLQVEFGNFVDRYITRALWVGPQPPGSGGGAGGGEKIHDKEAETILRTAMLPRWHFEVWQKHKAAAHHFLKRSLDNATTITSKDGPCQQEPHLVDLLNGVAEVGASADEMKVLVEAVERVSGHCRKSGTPPERVVLQEGRAFMSPPELEHLRESYRAYCDPTTKKSSALFHTYRVSLCSVVLAGRKSMWYHIDAFLWFRSKLNFSMPCIQRFVEDVLTANDPASARLKHALSFSHSSRQVGLHGEADLLLAGSCVVDFKCSRRAHDFSWLGQGLAYVAMSDRDQNMGVDRLQIFNPLLHTIWEYDCAGWGGGLRQGFLDALASSGVEKDEEEAEEKVKERKRREG